MADPVPYPMIINRLITASTFAPAIAAVWARHTIGDTARKAAYGWGALAIYAVVHAISFQYSRTGSPTMELSAIGLTMNVAMFLPSTIDWIGPGARRWLWPALLASWTLGVVIAMTVGVGRGFGTVMQPIISTAMWVVTALALAACVRRAPNDVRTTAWFWILSGQLLYFSVNIIRRPLIEALVKSHWDALIAVHLGLISLYPVCYLLVARGMLARTEPRPIMSLEPAA